MKINTVTVIGANGTMGCNVAGIFAAFGQCKVYMVCRNIEAAENARKKAMLSVKGESIGRYLIAADYSKLGECIQESDLIFESVREDMDTKREINKMISDNVDERKIVCTGTSGLSIRNLANCFSDEVKKNYMGLHFFNPPYSMILCEVIPCEYTDVTILEFVKEYAASVLRRTIVEVKDSPAFLGNRIGFQFINEAIQYAEKYKYNGGIDYIDAILGQFTGRNMPPIVTADFVGLDVHKAIVDNVYENTDDYAKETFRLSPFIEEMILKGDLGRKTKKGLYQTKVREDGKKEKYVYDISSGEYREIYIYNFPFAKEMIASLRVGDYSKAFSKFKENQSLEARLCMEFLLKYIIYSLVATQMVGDTIKAADDVMATGFGWIPPLALIKALGGEEEVKRLCTERLDSNFIKKVNIEDILSDVPESDYDYRKYFKAKQ